MQTHPRPSSRRLRRAADAHRPGTPRREREVRTETTSWQRVAYCYPHLLRLDSLSLASVTSSAPLVFNLHFRKIATVTGQGQAGGSWTAGRGPSGAGLGAVQETRQRGDSSKVRPQVEPRLCPQLNVLLKLLHNNFVMTGLTQIHAYNFYCISPSITETVDIHYLMTSAFSVRDPLLSPVQQH